MQMDRLPCVLRIHGGPIASETVPGGPIQPLKNIRGFFDVAIECGLRGKRWDGPQGRELGRRLKRAGVTVLLANYGQIGCALMPLCHQLGVRLVVHFHGYDAHMTHVVSDYRERYRELGQKAGAVIAVSEKMREALISYGIPQGKICLVRYGVDPCEFREKQSFPSTPLFFGVGRFVDKKAPYLTLLAFKQVLNAFPDARLVLAGEGELWEATRNLAEALGIDQAVSFPGVIAPERVAQYMQEATAFVQHSVIPRYGPAAGDSEGTPVAITEALMTGLPVISTRHAGIGEVVRDGETGFLVDERDTGAMANAMITLASDPAKGVRMGKCARQEAITAYTASHYIAALQAALSI